MELAKTVINTVKFPVLAGRADSKGVLGPILSQLQVNANAFCEEFNERTIGLDLFDDMPIFLNVILKLYDDKTYSFTILKPSSAAIIRLVMGLASDKESSGVKVLTISQLIWIARFKYKYVNLHSACSMIMGTAKSMGVTLVR